MFKKIKDLFIKYEEIIRYLIVGGLTTLVSFAIYYPLIWYVFDANDWFQHTAANLISWIGSVAFAYVTNRIFVFKSRDDKVVKEAAKFVSSRVGSYLAEQGILLLFYNRLDFKYAFELFGYSFPVVKIIAQVVVIILNYVLGKFLVFNKKKEEPDASGEEQS